MAKRLWAKHLASTTQFRRGAALAVALATVTGAAVYAGASGAGAAAAPTISQVKAKVNSLQAKMDKIDEQYDAANQEFSAAQARLTQVDKETASAQARYQAARGQLAQLAVSMYENSEQTSILGLLNAGDAATVLSQASLVTEVAGAHNQEATQFLTAARELTSIRQQRQRTEMGIGQIRAQLTAQKTSLNKLLDSSKATLDSLTLAQQEQVNRATVGTTTSTSTGTGQAGTTPVSYTGPTSTQAEKAVAYEYAQIGKPYEWGATGPASFDCSGLAMSAWASAGVDIPRTTYEMWADLPHIPVSEMQPGDLIIYDGEGHVGMFVGNGYIIDAPHTGADVERIPYDTSWYIDNEDGVLRP